MSFEARGQIAPKSVQFGVAAGAAIPTSDLSNAFNTGFNVTGVLGFQPDMIPLGVRVDVAYNQFGRKVAGANAHFTSVTGNLVYKIPSTGVSPYLIGGAGWYNTATGGASSENDFGWNLGGGITLPLSGFETFIEARYNQVQVTGGSLKFIPVTFGVMF